ncbi:MAG: GDP-mannose 4,6-dehydratase, partial [Sulfobacillus sp.]
MTRTLPSNSLWRGRSVLVTGHTGFKGSWLSLWLDLLGASVSGFSLEPPTEPSNFALSHVVEHLSRHTIGDVRDTDAMRMAIERSEPDVIFHLAAQPIVRRAMTEPRSTFETNVMGVVNLLEVVRNVGRPCSVVVVTTDKCYEIQRGD